MLVIGKKGSQIVTFTYEANNKYFDILLDSINNIIYKFNIEDKKYEASYKIDLDTSKIEWSNNKELDKMLKKTKRYKLAKNHYLVNYSIPEIFEMDSLSTASQFFTYRGSSIDQSISLTATIYNVNIYDDLLENHKFYKADGYYDVVEKLEKKDDHYIYRVTYKYKFDSFKGTKIITKDESEIIYPLDKNHVFVIKIKAENIGLTDKFIESIKFHSFKYYFNYTDNKKENGKVKAILKQYPNYQRDKIEYVTLELPDKYKEIDKDNNLYESRSFVLNYISEKYTYDYQIDYKLGSYMDSFIEIENDEFERYGKIYGPYKALEDVGDVTLNDKVFKVYAGGRTYREDAYTDLYYKNVKILFYELPSGEYLIIKVMGNGFEISDDLLKEVTNFDIKVEKVKKKEGK